MTEFNKLDKIDRKILYHLDINARMSDLQIARKLKTSREVVAYRIKRLIKNDVINRFFTHIRAEKLGYTIYKMYLKIKGLKEIEEEELINYFVQHKNVYRVTACDGIYDLIVSITAQDVYKLNEMLQQCFHRYDANFLSKDVTISIKIFHSRREYLIGKDKNEVEPLIRGGEKGNLNLDVKDTEILKILANNARMPIIDIAKMVGLTSSAVIYRIKELQNKELISAYRCSVNLEKIGYIRCKVFLALHFIDLKKENELRQFCMQHPNIIFFIYCIGHWDFEIEFEIESTIIFHNLLAEMKIRFADIIREYGYVIISKEYKFDYFPGSYPAGYKI